MMDQEALESLAGEMAEKLREGSRLYLTGDLGAGKSVFARAVLRKMGVEGDIPSPSFIVDAVYRSGDLDIHHVDLYRLSGSPAELEFYGIDQVLDSRAVVIVEWADRLDASDLPEGTWVDISFTNDPMTREVRIDDGPLAGD